MSEPVILDPACHIVARLAELSEAQGIPEEYHLGRLAPEWRTDAPGFCHERLGPAMFDKVQAEEWFRLGMLYMAKKLGKI